MKKWLFNPFTYVAGLKALLIGWTAMICTAVIGCFSHTHFDGIIDIHSHHDKLPLLLHLAEQFCNWLILTVIFYVAGKLFSGSAIRLIDVAGTMAMARWVMIFPAILGFAVDAPESLPQNINDIMQLVTPLMIVVGLLSGLFVVWMVALYFSAYVVSCNVKGMKASGPFIIGIVLAELCSVYLTRHFLTTIIS